MKDKTEGETIIPLTPYVAQLLHELKCKNETPPPEYRILNGKRIKRGLDNWTPSPWVFASKTAKSGYLQEPSKQHKLACMAAGIEGLTIHGLRRSFGTLSEWVECPAGIAAQIQGHAPSGTREKHYIRRPLDLLRMWHTKIEAWILEQAGIEQPKADAKPGLRSVTSRK
jgi:integrase